MSARQLQNHHLCAANRRGRRGLVTRHLGFVLAWQLNWHRFHAVRRAELAAAVDAAMAAGQN